MSKLAPHIKSQSLQALEAWLAEHGHKPYRAKQICEWVWQHQVKDYDEMLNLPLALRDALRASFSIEHLEIAEVNGAKDTTQKFLFKLEDGRFVESVLIPANIGKGGVQSSRQTLCVSSQVGCAYGCKFCASGLLGLTRNLSTAEIVQQIVQAQNHSGKRIDNLVFMGMGEPMANLPNVLQALDIITHPWMIGIGARHITLSTSGLAPQVKKLAMYPQQVRLAISLHGATDEVREQIMPVNKKWKLEELFESLDVWVAHKKQRLTFEYILIKGINDSLEQAKLLAKHATRFGAKVNLIPYNTVEGLEWERPAMSHCQKFQREVIAGGVTTTLRIEKGHDINAACGQLRLRKEQSLS